MASYTQVRGSGLPLQERDILKRGGVGGANASNEKTVDLVRGVL